MRQYQPIWEQLKKESQASIAVPVSMHSRVIKAVIKEKYSDIGFKLLLLEENKITKLIIEENGTLINFTLEYYKPPRLNL